MVRLRALVCLLFTLVILGVSSVGPISEEPIPSGPTPSAKKLSEFSQHFNEPGGDLSPWMFIPGDNIKKISNTEHPGMVTLWENGKGQNIKGILQEPIRIDEHPFPWEFHLSLVQNAYAMHGIDPKKSQSYAIGLNVAVTFSDPSTWPEDRTEWPPDTHWIQLLLVHLGDSAGMGPGLPQYMSPPATHETYLVWGRGDLGHGSYLGNWEIPYNTVGDGGSRGGAASDAVYFRFVFFNPNWLQIGIRSLGLQAYAYNMKHIHCNDYGNITGIWEIGPVFVCDRWIPDELCPNLPVQQAWHIPGELRGKIDEDGNYSYKWEKLIRAFEPKPPDPFYRYYLDYAVFFGAWPQTFEELSDDFDIPGFMANWQAQCEGTLADTYSNPGYMTITMPGASFGTGVCPVSLISNGLDLSVYEPPWEIECAFIGPDDSEPWNLFWFWMMFDPDHNNKGVWTPGVQNHPQEKRHRYFNRPDGDESLSFFQVKFKEEPPESIMAAKPLYMLIQVIDHHHLRVGFRANPEQPWYLSEVYDATEAMGGPIGKFISGCVDTATGGHWGGLYGHPMFQRFLIDYVRYRKGLSTDE